MENPEANSIHSYLSKPHHLKTSIQSPFGVLEGHKLDSPQRGVFKLNYRKFSSPQGQMQGGTSTVVRCY